MALQRRSMFIQTETTPNPESLKYIPGEVVLDEKYGTGMYFRQGDSEVNRSPLAKKLLKIPGVLGVFLGRTFITITKSSEIIWQVGPVRTDAPYSRPLEALSIYLTDTHLYTHTHINQKTEPQPRSLCHGHGPLRRRRHHCQ